MKLPFCLPSGVTRFWRGCRIEEKLVLCATSLLVPFCLGFEYSMQQSKLPLPPLFRPALEQNVGSKTAKSGRGKGNFLLVHVIGKVKHPGLQRLPASSRVFEAVEASGGATDVGALNALNLAARVQDGEKIVVSMVPQSLPRATETAAAEVETPRQQTPHRVTPLSSRRTAQRKTLPAGPINLNTASAQELEALPGVGPALASRIVAAREAGRFSSLSDLDRVKGIGPKKLEALRPYAIF